MHSFDLPNKHHKTERLRFDWEPSTGTVTGPDAERVREWVSEEWVNGRIWFPHPCPGVTFKTGNPLTDPRGMYLILEGRGYEVPPWLVKLRPRYRHRKEIEGEFVVY